jgi:putative MATE family efflux protein
MLMNRAKLTEGKVTRQMISLSVPMMAGIFSAIGFNLSDTYFVSLMGTQELAAMSFTFPVVMVLVGVAWGLGTGTSSVVARAVSGGHETFVRRICTDSLSLGFLSVLFLAGVGMMTIGPVFRFLGASDDLLPLIRSYMEVWYIGMICLVIPMVANASIRACGETRTPALIIIAATVSNVILDPILIFGWMGIPAMGLRGAAIATVIARGGTMVASLLVLYYRERLLDLSLPKLSDVWRSWKAIGEVAVPATMTNVFVPIGSAVVTRLVAEHGPSAVAAWGVGSRITAFVLIPIHGYCSGLAPFVGQNWGAGLLDRVRSARNLGYGFSLVWGAVSVAALYLLGNRVAAIFTSDPAVAVEIERYLMIIPVGYALVGVFSVTDEALNAIGRPILAASQTFVHTFALAIPLAIYGGRLAGMEGLLMGLVVADWGGGLFGLGAAAWSCRACFIGRGSMEVVEAD